MARKGGHQNISDVQSTVDEPLLPDTDKELKLDLETKSFSAENALYFAELSTIAYKTMDEVKSIIRGDDASPGMGFDRFHWFEADPEISNRSMLDAIQDTEAYVVANDSVIIVVFRGTMELADWATNLKLSTRAAPAAWGLGGENNALHMGFDDGVNTVWVARGMRDTIKSLYHGEGKDRKLFLTGHSLGAALATIAAAHLAFEDDINLAAMYTFGSPTVFNGSLAAQFDAKINHETPLKHKCFRCRNNNDIVPRAPMYPYTHVGIEIYINRFGRIASTSCVDRLLGRLCAYLRADCCDGVSDHSMTEYIRLLKAMAANTK